MHPLRFGVALTEKMRFFTKVKSFGFYFLVQNDRLFACHPEEQSDEGSQNIWKVCMRFFTLRVQNDRTNRIFVGEGFHALPFAWK